MWTALITKQTKIAMYVFTPGLVYIGPAKSKPHISKGFAGVILSAGKSAMSW